ncbi:hypothetical protein KSF_091600 [Reticulibacter mediterranei]|uniref:Uncharacterized protein n=1 Tax=Reticulibacter mediterranei TaxID=2778369 RepID=A0A8J3N5C0_9CHLR|nr:hypothetical protein [Reticulibacter mediterranei]GHO99112.1 hypothetical protein KSF_091600 [Reticulibacter mediterranei]
MGDEWMIEDVGFTRSDKGVAWWRSGALRLSPLGVEGLLGEREVRWPGERDKRKAPARNPLQPLVATDGGRLLLGDEWMIEDVGFTRSDKGVAWWRSGGLALVAVRRASDVGLRWWAFIH